jgi:hypothetical protein
VAELVQHDGGAENKDEGEQTDQVHAFNVFLNKTIKRTTFKPTNKVRGHEIALSCTERVYGVGQRASN